MFLIGSRALVANLAEEWAKTGAGFYRPVGDWDLIGTSEELTHLQNRFNFQEASQPFKYISREKGRANIEFEVLDHPLSRKSSQLYASIVMGGNNPKMDFFGTLVPCASLPILFSIKKSHIFKPRNFEKHIKDYSFLGRRFNFQDIHKEITDIRIKEQGSNRTLSLNRSRENFFNDKVKRLFVHDEIHEMIKFRDIPLYRKILKEESSVACSKEKFCALTREEQLESIMEEAIVIALERRIIPFLYQKAPFYSLHEAYCWALKRICTDLTSGWFRWAAIDNYSALTVNFYRARVKIEDFLRAVEQGGIKPINVENIQTS